MLSCDITTNKYALFIHNTMCTVFSAGVNAVLTNTVVFPLCSTYQCQRLEIDCMWFMWCFLCRLRSIAAHRDHCVRHPSACLYVCLSVCPVVTLSWLSPIVMFRRRRMHSLECCHYFNWCLFKGTFSRLVKFVLPFHFYPKIYTSGVWSQL